MGTSQYANTTVNAAEREIPCLIPASEISGRVRELGEQISADYAGKPLLVVGILHGAYVFMADLVRRLSIPVRCGFVMVSSYRDRTVTSGQVELRLDLTRSAEGEHVLLVDDVLDTGLSTSWLLGHLAKKDPASLRLCVLLNKPARRRVPVEIDYVGFEIPDRFVVGYGIDYADRHRQLPYVGYLPTDEQGEAR